MVQYRVQEEIVIPASLDVTRGDSTTRIRTTLFGPSSYQLTGKEIISNGLELASPLSTVEAISGGYGLLEGTKRDQRIIDTLNNKWITPFTIPLWTEDGVFVIRDPKALGRAQKFSIKDLEARIGNGNEVGRGIIFSQDGLVGFAPKDTYSFGTQDSHGDMANDGHMIATYSPEGAEMLAKVSEVNPGMPCLDGIVVNKGDAPQLRVSSLVSDGDGLYAGGLWGDCRGYCGFGVERKVA